MTMQAAALNGFQAQHFTANLLDQMIEEGQTQREQARAEPMGLDDLIGGLIGESLQERDAREQLKIKRKLAKNTALPGSTIHTLRNEIRELEYKAEWNAVADVIWIKRCVCDQCGSETPQFAGYFRKSHSRISKAYRYTALSAEAESSLPREMKTEMTRVAMCADCIPQILMEDGWLTSELPEELPIEADVEEEELLQEELDEPQEFQGQESNQIEQEDGIDPPFVE